MTLSDPWTKAQAELQTWRNEYGARTGAALTAVAGLPAFTGKALPRLKEKVVRDVERNGVAALYRDGAVVPSINDLVRARISASYLDGVDVIANHLERSLKESGLVVTSEKQQKLRGYYAIHLSFERTFLFRFLGDHKANVRCEIQIATELATTIWDRTHGTYEFARTSDAEETSWMWNPDDPRFLAAQLAHMIHLADGLIVQLREKTKARKGSDQ